ncbi:MAG: hypothetical protein DRI34_01775 [Deltaproteobacteria bacterium]|nr:MAG: hypothetical protein DRI34_01775 [Deltaproteobacteria bacterium]
MPDYDDDSGQGKRPRSGDEAAPELVADDDVLLVGEDEDTGEEAEETTGRYEIPPHVMNGGPAEPEEAEEEAGPQLLDEETFEEDTSELDPDGFLAGSEQPEEAEPVSDDLDDTGREEIFPPAEQPAEQREEEDVEGEERLGDTLDEPLSARRRARRRRFREKAGVRQQETVPGVGGSEEAAGGWQEATPPEGEAGGEEAGYLETGEEEAADEAPWNQQLPSVAEATAVLQADEAGADASQEKTLIFGEDEQAEEPVYPVLLVLQGEEEGREIELIPDHVTVGRGADNDLVLPDIACSRRHAVFQRQGQTLTIADLGSGNGTVVNGQRIQEIELQDGDEIQLGTTVLQLIWPQGETGERNLPGSTVTGARAYTESAASNRLGALLADPRRRKLVVFGGGGVLGLLLVLLLVKLVGGSGGTSRPADSELKRQQMLEQKRAFDRHFEKTKQLIDEMKWQEAALEIQLALKLQPSNSLLLEYKAFVEKEMTAQAALTEASKLFSGDDFTNAILAANRIPATSKYYEQARKLIQECRQKSMEKIVAEGKQLLGEKKYAQALLKFEEVLERDPQNEVVAALKARAEDVLEKEKRRLAALQKKRRHKRRPRPRKRKSSRSLTGQVLAFYRNGELDRAIQKAEEIGAQGALVKLKKFKAVYNKGKQLAHNRGQVRQAIDYLSKAYRLDKGISGGRGKYHDTIKDLLAKNYFVSGVDAFMGEHLPQAYKAFVRARDLGYHKAAERLAQLEKIGKRLFNEAYIIKANNPDQALQKLQIVVRILPPRHVYYGKAKKLMAQLSGGSGGQEDVEGGF